MSGVLFIVSAASGTGKTSLVKRLLDSEPSVQLSVSYTTRAPREGEVDGKDYHFISRAKFEDMIQAGDFLEYADVYGNYYGTSNKETQKKLLEHDVLLEIDWQGAKQVMSAASVPVVSIFVLPPSMMELENRLRGRAKDDEATIKKRMAAAIGEILHASSYQFVIINQDFEEACLDLRSVIRSTRQKLTKHQATWQELISSVND